MRDPACKRGYTISLSIGMLYTITPLSQNRTGKERNNNLLIFLII